MDFKELLEKTGFKVKENRFLNTPAHPYIVFFDDQTHRGADNNVSMIVDHEVTVNLYVKSIEDKTKLSKLEEVLDSIFVEYRRTIEWMDEDSIFEVRYTFTYTEKKRRKYNV